MTDDTLGISGTASTRYYALDLRTGITYGIKLDAEGNCLAIQAMKTVVRNKNEQDSLTFDPAAAPAPFGQTITAVEINGQSYGQVFTMVWPSEADFEKGARPTVTKKDLPQDLIKAGIAPMPQSAVGTAEMDAAVAEASRRTGAMLRGS